MHLYRFDSTISMRTAFLERCEEIDGWWGFTNPSNINIPNKNDETILINRLINNKKACEFIDLYPDRSLYSFVPKDGNPQLIKVASDRYSGGQTIVQRQNDGNIVANATPMYDYHATNKQYVDSLFATLSSVEFKIVDTLPTTNISKTTIYLKAIQGKEEYEEYIYIENKWELLGTTQIDLSNYLTKDMILTDEELDSILL